MSVTSVYPPTSTPGGWYGCFGPPTIKAPDIAYAWQTLGTVPCGNGTVASCCLLGDLGLSNGVCQIMPVANDARILSYYGAYCTDPTFSSPECTSNCAIKYMVYCGCDNIWQCADNDREHTLSECHTSSITISYSSTFFMIEPSKLAITKSLASIAPTTIEAQYVPTQWGKPQRVVISVSPTIIESGQALKTLPTSSVTSSTSSSASTASPATLTTSSIAPSQQSVAATTPDSQNLSKTALNAIISIAAIGAFIIAIATLYATI
ncbi:hypothetical protein VTL71DRAFT_16233 [Oculimacula yallundae]|uniref:Uncharacterized protein n=1 Tax=Oculimacula yallundae TaxID=86028 RepID=A0ABR4CDW6_9HELO